MLNSGLYIHIPFCKRKCAYCDFYSLINSEQLKQEYISALLADIIKQGGVYNRLFDTVYIGGGTPSLLGDNISDLLSCIKQNFNVSEDAEITAEVNPDVSYDFLRCAYKSGVNRISVGIQSGNNSELKILGRTHTAENAKKAIELIKSIGFKNISADLMIALPESNLKTLKNNLDYFLALDIPHISSYILKIEENTRFGKFPPALPDDDSQADQYLFMCEYLESNGYEHYEISNFAKKGFESRHNLKYWLCGEYLGFGPSAHSFMNGKRFFYERDIKKYISNPVPVFDTPGGTKEEKLMLGLRLKSGVLLSDFKQNQDMKKLTPFIKADLLKKDGNRIFLTNKGMLVSNSVIAELSEILL